MTTTTTTERTLTYPSLDISAPESAWAALGVRGYGNTDEVGSTWNLDHPSLHAVLFLARHAVGNNGPSVIAWAMTELQRRAEEKSRITAQAREAEAIKALAAAIAEGGEDAVLGRILGRLTAKTQYAVRAALGRSPL